MPSSEEKIVVDDVEETVKDKKPEAKDDQKSSKDSGEKHERTFLTFSDHDTFRSTMSQKRPRVPQQKICPITRLPAKYFDPVTRLPYANLQAFKFLRTHYYNHLELKGDREDPEVAAWIAWRNKNKHLQQQMHQQQQAQQAHNSTARNSASASSGFSPLLARSVSVPHQPAVALPTHPSPQVQPQQQQQAQPMPIKSPAVLPPGMAPVATMAQQQQSVVLPVRTTPLSVTAPIQASNFVASAPALPTQPSAAVTGMQTVRIATPGGQTTQVV